MPTTTIISEYLNHTSVPTERTMPSTSHTLRMRFARLCIIANDNR